MRASRRWLAALMILGFTLAQAISLAHACRGGPESSFATAQPMVGTAAMPADCLMIADAASSTGAACDAHCLPREQVDKGSDVRIAALAPPSSLVVRVVQPRVPRSVRATAPFVRAGSPPLSLLFGRFLI